MHEQWKHRVYKNEGEARQQGDNEWVSKGKERTEGGETRNERERERERRVQAESVGSMGTE